MTCLRSLNGVILFDMPSLHSERQCIVSFEADCYVVALDLTLARHSTAQRICTVQSVVF